jgi:RHS repeat-associated protein
VAVTDVNRKVIERSEYEPFGKLLNRPLTDGPDYTGHVGDTATGLSYMQQRYYDPMIGRFLSVDPVTATSMGGNFNRYWYADNNPYRFTDPDGRNACGTSDDSTCKVQITIISRPRDDSGKYNDQFAKTKNSENYNAVSTVTVNGKESGQFLTRTLPSDQKKFATVANGNYVGSRTMHKGKYLAIAYNGNKAVPTLGLNPAHPSQNSATGVQIHRSGVGNFTGIDSKGRAISEGCTVIARDQYSSFLAATGLTPTAGAPQSTFSIGLNTDEN